MPLCNDCPRRCGALRTDTKNTGGICGVPYLPTLARAGLHFGEEPFISGQNGSGTIFFSGCSLRCVFCQNHEISHERLGKPVSVNRLVQIMKELEGQKAHNINFVTPTHYFGVISSALKQYRPNVPLVYNTSGYDLAENIEKDLFDIYLFDLKFFSPERSARFAKCSDYFEVASKAIQTAVARKGTPVYDENGMMQSGVVVRHLILPQATNESIQIIDWLSETVGPSVVLSLMSQYVPMYHAADFTEINRRITKREYNKVLSHCYDKNFADIFIQSSSSATTDYIPKFDLSGI